MCHSHKPFIEIVFSMCLFDDKKGLVFVIIIRFKENVHRLNKVVFTRSFYSIIRSGVCFHYGYMAMIIYSGFY